jgi:hypothetical protein
MGYSAADVIGKKLYAASRVPIQKLPFDNELVLRTAEPGELVGVVYTYFEPKAGRSVLYWGFKDQYGNNYYAAHRPEYYSTQKLREQGVLTVEEKKALENQNPLAATVKNLFVGGLITWGIVQLGKEYIKKKA